MISNEKVIIVGPSGSGKDFMLRQLNSKGLKRGVKSTTRPKRINETESIDYHFISDDDFRDLLDKGELICYQSFLVTPEDRSPETWMYGITRNEFTSGQVFIMTPHDLSQVSDKDRKGMFVVYLDIDRSIRESRVLNRNDKNDSVMRRLDSDDIDFMNFRDYDLKITDPEFSSDLVIDLMV